MKQLLLVFACSLGLAGCITIPVNSTIPAGPLPTAANPKVPGKYAAVVNSGKWTLHEATAQGTECSAYQFTLDVNSAYEQLAKAYLAATLQAVDFMPAPLNQQQIAAGGYDAQIIMSQSDNVVANATFRGALLFADTEVTIQIATLSRTGATFQNQFSGKGATNGAFLICDAAADYAADAFQRSLNIAFTQAMSQTRQQLDPARKH